MQLTIDPAREFGLEGAIRRIWTGTYVNGAEIPVIVTTVLPRTYVDMHLALFEDRSEVASRLDCHVAIADAHVSTREAG